MFVYFIKADASPPMLKIGKARRPHFRLQELQTGCPFKLGFVGALRCKNDGQALDLEWHLHRMFRREAYRGEWFRYTGHMPYCVNQLVRFNREIAGDWMRATEVFREAIAHGRKFEKPKNAPDAVEVDSDSLSHMRSIAQESRS